MTFKQTVKMIKNKSLFYFVIILHQKIIEINELILNIPFLLFKFVQIEW